ncbi:MAG: PRTRC system protein E [Dysgonomonas mossii]|uniref:PRTRC system protein E n=1 Tax=Dysgonomonas mossii TaxID=163665 RepID=UPI003993E408
MFFTQINQMMSQGVDITLVIRKKEGQLIVSTMPKTNGLKDEAQNHIVPLTVTGTPQELDMGFMQTICQPIQKATGLLINMSQFEEQADKAAANSKATKEQKDKVAKEAKEKKEKFDKLMKKASEQETELKFADALASLKQARTFAASQEIKSVDEKINALRMKMRQGSLFEMEPAPVPQVPSIQTSQPQETQQVQQSIPQAVQQPVYPQHANVNMNGGQQIVQQPVQQNGYGNGNYPSNNNGQQLFTPYTEQPQQNNTIVNNGQSPIGLIPDPEPVPAFVADYSAHREGEYDQYPDFPGYPANTMYNQ